MNKGKLYLIPTILGEGTQEATLPSPILKSIQEINVFIVENLRTARRHIKKIYREKDIDATTFYSYGKHDTLNLEQDFLPHILSGENVGLLSEAGLPCVADPGSKIVEYAHDFQIDVVPFVGPSSILLALMASGMNGQNFAFNGYLPIEKVERKSKMKQLEKRSFDENQSQLFIETPYRNNSVLEDLYKTLNSDTKICVACDLTLPTEYIKTQTAKQWKHSKLDFHKRPAIFIIHKY